MRKFELLIASLLLVSGLFAQKSIVVTNSSALDRKGEMVEVKTCCKKSCIVTKSVVLKNEKGDEIPYQLIYNDKNVVKGLIFQADVKAKSTATYSIIEGKPAIVKARTFGRFIPERKDDFAWENDFAAYRMYGPALAKENPSNGVDYWAKKTDELIVDEFYNGELKQGLSYHRDRGHGLDFYKVGHTLGCGGIAPYASDSLWVGNHYNSYKVLENGPLRTVFTLTYDSVKVGNEFYKQTITIKATAGSLLNKAVVTYTGKAQKMQLATGIFLHDGKGNLVSHLKSTKNNSKPTSRIGYAEEAISEFKEPSGRNYVGVVVSSNGNIQLRKKGIHAMLLSDYSVGKSFTYYFGGGWNNWKFPTDNDWFNTLEEYSIKVSNPLKVKLK
ncbi:MAG TPA: DUF4861 family protein [Paludibacter sp.]|nr:DUF4861 family protein [Paludibacter sp.]